MQGTRNRSLITQGVDALGRATGATFACPCHTTLTQMGISLLSSVEMDHTFSRKKQRGKINK